MIVLDKYLESIDSSLEVSNDELIIVLKPDKGCSSCYNSMIAGLKDQNASFNNSDIIIVGEMPEKDKILVESITKGQIHFDPFDSISTYNLKAFDSGYLKITNNNVEFHTLTKEYPPK